MRTALEVTAAILAGAVIGATILAALLHVALKPFIHVAYLLAG